MTKPSIVFAHGLWADGSCFGKLIQAIMQAHKDQTERRRRTRRKR